MRCRLGAAARSGGRFANDGATRADRGPGQGGGHRRRPDGNCDHGGGPRVLPGEAAAQRCGLGEVEDRPAAGDGLAPEGTVGVHRDGVADGGEHGDVGDRVAVGIAVLELVPANGRQLTQGRRLVLAVGVEGDLAGVATVLDDHAGGDHVIGAEHSGDGFDQFGAARRDDHHVAPGGMVLVDERDRLPVDRRLDEVDERLGDDLSDLLHLPSGHHRRDVLAHPLHLVVVGAGEQEDDVGVGGTQHGATVDQAAVVERAGEGERRGAGDDRLVEVEEGGCRHRRHRHGATLVRPSDSAGARPLARSFPTPSA